MIETKHGLVAVDANARPSDDRRKSDRTPPRDAKRTVILRDSTDEGDRVAQIVNESPEGMGICLTGPDPPAVGTTVAIEQEGSVRPASVCWVLWKRDVGWRIGLKWIDLEWSV